MKKAIVNFALGAWYPRGQKRLRDSIAIYNNDTEFIGFTNYNNLGSPTHQQVPYAFKTYALMYCLNKQYDQAIYVDASIYAIKSWKPIWDIIDKQGYYFEEAGHWVGNWTKDSLLNKFGISRDEAMMIPMFTAGFTGLNLKNDLAIKFLKLWHGAACDGNSFNGTWDNKNGIMSKDVRCKGHRHDMSVASILAWKLGMKYGKGGTFLAYIGKSFGIPKETVVAYLKPC